jgi:hypothetical protein
MANENIRKSYAGAAEATVVVGTITSVSTVINALDASSYPDGSVGPFVVRLDGGQSNEEKVLVSSRAGNVLTVVERGYDGTVAVGHSDVSLTHCLDSYSIDQANQMANVGTLAVAGAVPFWNGTVWVTAAAGGDVNVIAHQPLLNQIDERSTTLTYTGDDLTQVLEKDGATTVKQTDLTYAAGKLTTVVEVAGGDTVTTALVYTGDFLTSTTRTLS